MKRALGLLLAVTALSLPGCAARSTDKAAAPPPSARGPGLRHRLRRAPSGSKAAPSPGDSVITLPSGVPKTTAPHEPTDDFTVLTTTGQVRLEGASSSWSRTSSCGSCSARPPPGSGRPAGQGHRACPTPGSSRSAPAARSRSPRSPRPSDPPLRRRGEPLRDERFCISARAPGGASCRTAGARLRLARRTRPPGRHVPVPWPPGVARSSKDRLC